MPEHIQNTLRFTRARRAFDDQAAVATATSSSLLQPFVNQRIALRRTYSLFQLQVHGQSSRTEHHLAVIKGDSFHIMELMGNTATSINILKPCLFYGDLTTLERMRDPVGADIVNIQAF